MSDTPVREPPPGTKRQYWFIDPDMTDEEIDAWAAAVCPSSVGQGGRGAVNRTMT